MKTIRFLGVALLTVLMSISYSACSSSSDDDNEVVPEVNPLVGTWYGEHEWFSSTLVCKIVFEGNYYGSYMLCKKSEVEDNSPKSFIYKVRESNRLSLYWENGDSLVFYYTITSNTLTLKAEDRVRIPIENLVLNKQ